MTPSDAVIAVDSENTAQAAGCHAGEEVMRDAAAKAGKSAQLEQYDKDYPKGPHMPRLSGLPASWQSCLFSWAFGANSFPSAV